MVKVTLGIAKCWKQEIMMAQKKLSDDLQAVY
jgi:hypothetical protein